MGVSGIVFLKALLLSVTESFDLHVSWSSMHAMVNPYIAFDLFFVLMMGSECVWDLGEGSNFQLVRGPQS